MRSTRASADELGSPVTDLRVSRGNGVPSIEDTVIAELVPESQRRRERGELGETLLEVKDLHTSFRTTDGVVQAVTGVDFAVRRGEILGLVGESGCGKSVTSLSILRLINPPGRIDAGQVLFDGQDLLRLPEDAMRKLRGNRISMIFQQPTSALNPVLDIGFQVGEVLETHRNMKRKAARGRALELLRMVGIADPERRLKAFPHETSGGMAQRVMIAMALACEPELLIADEPTTALDVTIQAQILDLMRRLQQETGTAIILITHDLGVVAEMADRVAVMYAGEIVEQADTETLFSDPRHPYTKGLIASIPILGEIREELAVIPGNVPNLIDLPPACRFAPRCVSRVEESVELSTERHPALLEAAKDHDVRCWMYHDPDGRLIRTEAPASFRPGASSISGSVAVDERGDMPELGGTHSDAPSHHDAPPHHDDAAHGNGS